MARFENVTFLQDDGAAEFFALLDEHGESAALDWLTEWHNPGEHDSADELGHGTADSTYRRDGYVMAYNRALEYVGLSFDTEAPENYPAHFDRFDICEAWYLALSHCHGGQSSPEYARLCKLTRAGFFQPSPMLGVDSLTENGRAIYARACQTMGCDPSLED